MKFLPREHYPLHSRGQKSQARTMGVGGRRPAYPLATNLSVKSDRWGQTWIPEGERTRPGLRAAPGARGKPARALAGEQCGDYSLETSLQACEIHTLFFIISFKTC